ncbi:MAG: MoaD/ThiS family protein [Defluviitaleaceae bacterium]|nr:MoaD/ThiS family protein [Defluviitaleaceae bacterium]
MKIEVQLYSYLRDGRGKTVELDVHEHATTADVIKMLNIGDNVVANMMINDVDAGRESALKEGDCLSLFPLLTGG